MNKPKYSLLLLPFLLLLSSFAVAQKSCRLSVDTTRILLNQGLDDFISKIETAEFKSYSDYCLIPELIRGPLDCLTNNFSIAKPNEEFRCCCTSSRLLPKRKLVYLGLSKNIFMMTYLTGGFAVSTHILLIKYDNERILDMWTGMGENDLTSKEAVLTFVKKNRHNYVRLHPYISL